MLAGGCASTSSFERLQAAPEAQRAQHMEARERLLDDYERWLEPAAVPVRRGAARVQVPVSPGWCYAFFAVGGDGVRDLDMRVVDSDGRELGADTMFDVTPFVQHCADRAESVTVGLTVARGAGRASVSVERKPD